MRELRSSATGCVGCSFTLEGIGIVIAYEVFLEQEVNHRGLVASTRRRNRPKYQMRPIATPRTVLIGKASK